VCPRTTGCSSTPVSPRRGSSSSAPASAGRRSCSPVRRWLPCPAPRWSKVWPTRSAEPWPRPPDASAPAGGSAQSRPVDDVVDERGVEVRDHIVVQGHGGLDLTLCFGDEQCRVVAVGI